MLLDIFPVFDEKKNLLTGGLTEHIGLFSVTLHAQYILDRL
jgi:hypothetical protein